MIGNSPQQQQQRPVPHPPVSLSRKVWLAVTFTLTYFVPTPLLRRLGNRNTVETQTAWREKVALFIIMLMLNAGMLCIALYGGRLALLILGAIFSAVTCIKFVAAFRFPSSGETKAKSPPSKAFALCFVPVFAERKETIETCLIAIADMKYDKKRKLLVVVCDGLVVRDGEERGTASTVLDILGANKEVRPRRMEYPSIGLGAKGANCAKVHAGIYETDEMNILPWIVIVKTGTVAEEQAARASEHRVHVGHRGKRDSQVLVLRFLNKVHSGNPMCPLELEVFHQINNIIGVDPELYEYLLMVDADTVVSSMALTRLLFQCEKESRITGICGVTRLINEEKNWWTMTQVYECEDSFGSTKAFESAFNHVTCLPGCFCMYRLRTKSKFAGENNVPLIISDDIIAKYARNASTLHEKNLVELGEDRYLTTLMNKHFMHLFYVYEPSATARTRGSDSGSAFFTQRRRWVNSSIHNNLELVAQSSPRNCFDLFPMRFFFFVELFGTFVMPAMAGSFGYLTYKVATRTGGREADISLIMVTGSYGAKMISFIVSKRWDLVGWMIIHVISFPLWWIVLPVVAFWKMDDFSWGSEGERRLKVRGEAQGRDNNNDNVVSIPMKTWNDFARENGLPGERHKPGHDRRVC